MAVNNINLKKTIFILSSMSRSFCRLEPAKKARYIPAPLTEAKSLLVGPVGFTRR
jgi:hypothetical protein